MPLCLCPSNWGNFRNIRVMKVASISMKSITFICRPINFTVNEQCWYDLAHCLSYCFYFKLQCQSDFNFNFNHFSAFLRTSKFAIHKSVKTPAYHTVTKWETVTGENSRYDAICHVLGLRERLSDVFAAFRLRCFSSWNRLARWTLSCDEPRLTHCGKRKIAFLEWYC